MVLAATVAAQLLMAAAVNRPTVVVTCWRTCWWQSAIPDGSHAWQWLLAATPVSPSVDLNRSRVYSSVVCFQW